uniref:WIF domain-containing protein n=1 Tax=Elaeophora elaphi TaxID=1147741 RepID=A0A0R3RSI3_9BILA
MILWKKKKFIIAFNIEYRCTETKTGKFDIQVNFNFDWPSSTNQTNVSLKQEKLCMARKLRRTYAGMFPRRLTLLD